MVANGTSDLHAANKLNHDRKTELKAFDDTGAGVKGLVDSKITKVPRLFLRSLPLDHHNFTKIPNSINPKLTSPVIDLCAIDKDPIRRKETVEIVGYASEKWGFFQVVNHGIPLSVLEEMKDGVRRFFEQDVEVKKKWYTRDYNNKSFVYNSNYDLYTTPAVNWRDTIYCTMAPNPPNPEEFPEVCRDILFDYSKQVTKLSCTLFDLLSEALGLNRNYFNDMDCAEGLALICHYYPVCPQPELTIGKREHFDNDFMTVLLQDHIGGLQVLHENQWIDVTPVPGALVVNIGDLLQLMSNDKFISARHRVLANHVGPRVSIASFLFTGVHPSTKLYEPIKELLSDDNPPKYRATTVPEYVQYYRNEGVNEASTLSHFKLK